MTQAIAIVRGLFDVEKNLLLNSVQIQELMRLLLTGNQLAKPHFTSTAR